MDAVTLKNFAAMVAQGAATPRPVVRALIGARPDGAQRLMIVGLGAAIQGMVWAVAGLLAPALAIGLAGHLALFSISFANYAITTALAFFVGRRFGGTGEARDVATAIGWHTVLTAVLAPTQLGAVGGGAGTGVITGTGLMLLLVYAALNVWLLAACIAEAHRFRSTGRVAAVSIGLFMALGLAASLLIGGLRPT